MQEEATAKQKIMETTPTEITNKSDTTVPIEESVGDVNIAREIEEKTKAADCRIC